MKILAIETSCDETACAIVEDGRQVLSNIIHSQIPTHQTYGGVIPELAAREHLDVVNTVVEKALNDAQCTLNDIDAFAATLGPGLVGALLVGAQTAKTLAWVHNKPFIGVNHLQGHIASNYLQSNLQPPFICLLVSGGHTQILWVKSYTEQQLLGETLDDAVGEAYDKVARILGIGYPGGPKLDKLAQGYNGPPLTTALPIAKTDNPFDFSFSGLKTATTRAYKTALAQTSNDIETVQAQLASAFQNTVAKTLGQKVIKAAETYEQDTIVIAGGVAANSAIRALFEAWQQASPERQFYCPTMVYCTDNAAMIAAAAYVEQLNGVQTQLCADVFSRS